MKKTKKKETNYGLWIISRSAPFRSKRRKKKRWKEKKNHQIQNPFLPETQTGVECVMCIPVIHRNRNTNLLRNYNFILILYFLGDALHLIAALTASLFPSVHVFWSDFSESSNKILLTKLYLTPTLCSVHFSMYRTMCGIFNQLCVRPTKSIHLLLWPFSLVAYYEYTCENYKKNHGQEQTNDCRLYWA